MSKIAMQLDLPGEKGEMAPERAYLLVGEDGSVVGVAGPVEYLPMPPFYLDFERGLRGDPEKALANELEKALGELGWRPGEYVVGPTIRVDRETMDMFAHNWGRDSREGILKAACAGRAHGETSLSAEATDPRFDKANDRELAAALWYLWRVEAPVVRNRHEIEERYPDGEVCQVGAYVMCVDDEGSVTVNEFQSAWLALGHMGTIAARRWWDDVFPQPPSSL